MRRAFVTPFRVDMELIGEIRIWVDGLIWAHHHTCMATNTFIADDKAHSPPPCFGSR